jgi:hypothetical protein
MNITEFAGMFRLTILVEKAPRGGWDARFDPKVSVRPGIGYAFAAANGQGETPARAVESLASMISNTEVAIDIVAGRPWPLTHDANQSYPMVYPGEGAAAMSGVPVFKTLTPEMFHVERPAADVVDTIGVVLKDLEGPNPMLRCQCAGCQSRRSGG